MKLDIASQNGVIEISHIFEEGGFVIKCARDGGFLLFEIPQYGGEERFFGTFLSIYDALETAQKWT